MTDVLGKQWQKVLGDQFDAPYMQSLRKFLIERKALHKIIFPHSSQWFRAFELTPLLSVKVVILGQDPYHGLGQAHGLCFSVQPQIPIPPSLQNIYRELSQDVGFKLVKHGFLESWAQQGVMLVNSVLTVEQGQAGSHRNQGWEQFTDEAIRQINEKNDRVVFLLWGSYAQSKASLIDSKRHLILRSVHPSPLSAHRGFFGQHHFSQTNAYLKAHNQAPIDWQLPQEVSASVNQVNMEIF